MKTFAHMRFWLLLGPFLALILCCIALMKSGTYAPCILLFMLPLCCRYRFFGLFASLALLGALVGYAYLQTPVDGRLWVVGNALAMAFTFVVTTLSCEEAEESMRLLEEESQSRLAQIRKLDEELRDEKRKRQREELQKELTASKS